MMTRLLGVLGSSLLVLAAACGGDDGNSSSTCGDGHVTGSETCDDGNTSAGDGCSSNCRSEGSCGDGTLDVSTEGCDDGNTTSGDGCSSTCNKEGTCGNGAVEPGETCDDSNTSVGDGCNALCATESGYTCTGTPSVCTMDGGGGSGSNTCSAPGVITLTASGTDLVGNATGDTTGATSGVAGAECDGYSDDGTGGDHVWSFTTTDVRDVLVVVTPDAAFDTNIRLLGTACDLTTELIDQVGEDGCSDYGGEGEYEVLAYVNLPAGTYYVVVDGYDDTAAGSYSIDITASEPTCGDGSLGQLELCDDGNNTDNDGCTHCTVDTDWVCDASEPSVCQMQGCGDGVVDFDEDCDDDNTDPNDGCSATCTIENGYSCVGEPSVCSVIACGNGIVEGTEECDDGNPTNGDRCNTSCVLEQDVTESEPNDTTPQVLTSGSHIIRATYGDGDVDLYTFTLTATSRVSIETYTSINGTTTDYDSDALGNPIFDCPSDDDDTVIALFPAAADVTDDNMALDIDDEDGANHCSYLGDDAAFATLAAGTYTIRVEPYFFATVAAGSRYMLDLKITPMGTGAATPAAGELKINEFLAADGGTTNGGVDSNCDGKLTDSDDEFIELVNVSGKTLDLTGVTYADALGVKFTFAAQPSGSLTLDANQAVVIWGGGTPACPGVTNFFTNGTKHTLSLNDSGDTITIATGGANPVTIASTTYTSAGAVIGKSQNLDPDVTGTTYKRHDLVTGAVGNLSPGKKANGTPF